jgi:hypothetical protein
MPQGSYGPWTTSLTTGSRLELSAFWKGRLNRLSALADCPAVSQRKRVSTVFSFVVVVALLPLFRAANEPATATESSATVVADTFPFATAAVPSAHHEAVTNEVALDHDLPNQLALNEADPREVTPRMTSSDDPQADEVQNAIRDAMAYLSGLQ